VHNESSNSSYRLILRGEEPFDNFCGCPDYRVSALGTCKHIEWALYKLYNTHGNKQHFRKPKPVRTYTSVYLHYGETRSLRIRIGTEKASEFQQLASHYFDEQGRFYEHAYLEFEQFLEQAKALSDAFRCYPDALEYILQKWADQRRSSHLEAILKQPRPFANLIKTKLYPYQKEGVAFAFKAGRALLADEMGLGKTIQAIATAELFRKEYRIGSVFIICPTSLKYQWQAEIQKFTDSLVQVIEGPPHKRRQAYEDQDYFYKILTYNVVARDYPLLNEADPDLIILDEAQRIKNWDTQISRAVKRLEAPYRLALTGTPLENKLEDLYSIVQFLDQYLLGPLYLLQYRHLAKDEYGIVQGYRHLDEIYHKLQGVMLRRRKKDVIKQLPERLDQNLFVPMTARQRELHESYAADVAQLVAKWRRHNFLSEKDRLRLMASLQMMRMSCDSTYIVDQKHRHDTKVDELFYILEEHLSDPGASAVIFSQWSRMTHLVASELEARNINFGHLHGGVPSTKRGELLDRFRDDPDCRVFLSTDDAGGVGLNLQKASLVINLDLPWNPAVLEQRIARVYRLGQDRPVQVINLIAQGTIEHQMLDKLRFKSSLAEAVLDTAADSVFMSDSKFKAFMETVENVTVETNTTEVVPESTEDEDLERPQAAAANQQAEASPAEALLEEWWLTDETYSIPVPPKTRTKTAAQPSGQSTNGRQASSGAVRSPAEAQELLGQGFNFLSRLSATLRDPAATRQLVDSVVAKDEKSGATYLKIPVENKAVVENTISLLGGLLAQLGK